VDCIGVSNVTAGVGGADDDSTAVNLESSLQSCTAHRERIVQMLMEEPNNQNLLDLRDQLTNAINQLQGTKDMVQKAQANRRPGGPGLGTSAMGGVDKGHSSRKNKPQRCSVCGGLGHKSRTCTMAQQQHPAAQAQMQQVQWAAASSMPSGVMPPNAVSGPPGMPSHPSVLPAQAAGQQVYQQSQYQQQPPPPPPPPPPGAYMVAPGQPIAAQLQTLTSPASGMMGATPQQCMVLPAASKSADASRETGVPPQGGAADTLPESSAAETATPLTSPGDLEGGTGFGLA